MALKFMALKFMALKFMAPKLRAIVQIQILDPQPSEPNYNLTQASGTDENLPQI
jgi:hypothetical protein